MRGFVVKGGCMGKLTAKNATKIVVTVRKKSFLSNQSDNNCSNCQFVINKSINETKEDVKPFKFLLF